MRENCQYLYWNLGFSSKVNDVCDIHGYSLVKYSRKCQVCQGALWVGNCLLQFSGWKALLISTGGNRRGLLARQIVMRHSFGNRDDLMKPLLFDELLPFLRFYSKVWLMDEDISLVGFNFRTYFWQYTWDCAFDPPSPPSVISQPLINGKGWSMCNNSVIASRSAWIGQQSPILDAKLFA